MGLNRSMHCLVLFLGVLLIAGCSAGQPKSVTALVPVSSEDAKEWKIPQNLIVQGENNLFQVVCLETQKENMLELAAGNDGQMEYFLDNKAGKEAQGSYRLQFLSTQGIGRIKVSAFKASGELLGSAGMVYTGPVPENTPVVKWMDQRYFTNYQGGWLESTENLPAILVKSIPGLDIGQADNVRLSIEVGQGQHVLVARMTNTVNPAQALMMNIVQEKELVAQGDTVSLQTRFRNDGTRIMENLKITLVRPEGFGIIPIDKGEQVISRLAPGDTCTLIWQVRAQRPDAVNFHKAWKVSFAVNDVLLPEKAPVWVEDTRPGKIFYVMTEDLEPIDGAGYVKKWGNADGWLEPQEFMGQMVHKAERLNQIADQYGAKWTHYIAWPAVKAGEWAATQSATGKWEEAVSAIRESVKSQSDKGHEYALHMHTDYDPYLAGNLLAYNAKVDGIWANHLRHGWAHSVFNEGDFAKYDTRTGILYSYQKILDELESHSRQGQILNARAGSFDFGSGAKEEAVSTKACRNVGLWGSSDADGNEVRPNSGDYGQEIYLAQQDDINKPAEEFAKLGIVEFRPTPKKPIAYEAQDAVTMNAKADEGMKYFTRKGKIEPGVHGIIGFTHAMFMMGDGDWQSLTGGQFQALDQHLHYLKTSYADAGLLNFGTGSELVKAYLDYYAPQPVAVYGKLLRSGWGVSEYKIDILGHDIPINSDYIHTVSLKYPLYLRDSAYRIAVLKNGQPVYTTWGLPTPFNDIIFQVDDSNADYTLKIYHQNFFCRLIGSLREFKTKISK